jgi:hypothetical protein
LAIYCLSVFNYFKRKTRRSECHVMLFFKNQQVPDVLEHIKVVFKFY